MKTNQRSSVQNKQQVSGSQPRAGAKQSQPGGAATGGFNSMISNISDQAQDFGSTVADKVSHMSTTQKVLGGSLLALGAGWIVAKQAGWDVGFGHEKGQSTK
ncbi:MAG: hypothetical protein LPJ89_09290 [Hymenobacteraceae bacterium]|nr:hypothetical protein [Hymenobacteraceae bacterium]MDX5396122.1 hypothetical protein [Hymenobacteraceae bacterium]MDX5443959.1 hypothetical protein [Hymenobacteraceae bacterium]MDX5512183.1 hypothetical protein [Hymenobacteraceae bacterium]